MLSSHQRKSWITLLLKPAVKNFCLPLLALTVTTQTLKDTMRAYQTQQIQRDLSSCDHLNQQCVNFGKALKVTDIHLYMKYRPFTAGFSKCTYSRY